MEMDRAKSRKDIKECRTQLVQVKYILDVIKGVTSDSTSQ